MTENVIAGTYKIHVGNYDWGCSVDKAILTLDREMTLADMDRFADIRVKERKMVADEGDPASEFEDGVIGRKVVSPKE